MKIGAVTARKRFYQVPHCNGMGYRDPTALVHTRGVKAEGGWAVVCAEQVDFHYTSEITPFIERRLWDERDIPALSRMVDKIHEGGALAGIELACTVMLLEIVPAQQIVDTMLATGFGLARICEGFNGNRILKRYLACRGPGYPRDLGRYSGQCPPQGPEDRRWLV